MRRIGYLALASGILAFSGSPCRGASFSVSPVNIVIKAPSRTGSVTLANPGTEPVKLQARVFVWKQEAGKLVLTPATDVIVSPPLVSLMPETPFTLRIARLNAIPPATEASYRIILDELPSEKPDDGEASFLKLQLRASVPLFFAPAKGQPNASWKLKRTKESLELEVVNAGNRHLKLVNLALDGPDGKIEFTASGAEAYVLPGSTMTYRPSKPLSKTYPPGTTFTLTTNPSTPFAVNQQITLTGD